MPERAWSNQSADAHRANEAMPKPTEPFALPRSPGADAGRAAEDGRTFGPAQGPPIDPTRAQLKNYVLVFADDAPPKEHYFSAISHDHALALMKRQFAGSVWTLFCAEGGRQPVGVYPPEKGN